MAKVDEARAKGSMCGLWGVSRLYGHSAWGEKENESWLL
jgi:hypothetical protein